MNYIGIEKDSLLNGDGIRVILWVAGCVHHCWKCQNPSTWDPDAGIRFTAESMNELIRALEADHVTGLTLSGGDPLHPANIEDVTRIALKVKRMFGERRTIWVYTGYLWEDIQSEMIMHYVDVVVDGEYIDKLRDVNYPWAGSTNQRVIDAKKSISEGRIVLHDTDTGRGFAGTAEGSRCCR